MKINKIKFVKKTRQCFFGLMATAMSFGGAVATSTTNAFAADQSLSNNTGIATRKLRPTKKKSAKITMDSSKRVIFIGYVYTRAAKLTSSNKKDNIKYTSSNAKIATVSSTGKVTAKRRGTVTITASSTLDSKVKCSYQLKVIKKFKKNDKLFIAHRGYSSVAPENSIPAFEAAAKKGFGAIECDIYETAKDKKGNRRFVIMHDSTLNRMCKLGGKKVYQSKLTYDTIRTKYYIKNGANVNKYSKSQLRIPTLEEYLSICKKYNVKPVIEIKTDLNKNSVNRVYQSIKKAGLQNNATVISRYKQPLVDMKKKNKKIAIQLVTNRIDNNIIKWAKKYNAGLCMYKSLANNSTVDMLNRTHKIYLNLWTINSKEELSDYGYSRVGAITSNYALWS